MRRLTLFILLGIASLSYAHDPEPLRFDRFYYEKGDGRIHSVEDADIEVRGRFIRATPAVAGHLPYPPEINAFSLKCLENERICALSIAAVEPHHVFKDRPSSLNSRTAIYRVASWTPERVVATARYGAHDRELTIFRKGGSGSPVTLKSVQRRPSLKAPVPPEIWRMQEAPK